MRSQRQFCKFASLASGSKCLYCPRVLTRDYARHPIAPCLLQCRHLGASARLLRIPCGCTAKSEAAIAAGQEPPIISVPTAVCALAAHPRCIPVWAPHEIEKWREQPESRMYQLCSNCPDESLVVQVPQPVVEHSRTPIISVPLAQEVCSRLAAILPVPFDVSQDASEQAAIETSEQRLHELRLAGKPIGSGRKIGDVRRGQSDGELWASHELILSEVQRLAGTPTELRNHLIYPPQSAMAWHANGNAPGIRAYVIFNESEGSVFRYAVDDGPMIEVAEPAGWHLKAFTIPTPPRALWHAVWAGCWRVSIGFMVADCGRPFEAITTDAN